MTIANVTLTNTFDEWRVRTNQLIVGYNDVIVIANAAFDKANTGDTTGVNAYDTANAAFDTANTGDVTGISAYNTANAAYDRANTAGGGYFAGNNGFTGNANNKADIFRINTNTFTGNIVFAAGENASATGPLYMAPNSIIQILTGARVVII